VSVFSTPFHTFFQPLVSTAFTIVQVLEFFDADDHLIALDESGYQQKAAGPARIDDGTGLVPTFLSDGRVLAYKFDAKPVSAFRTVLEAFSRDHCTALIYWAPSYFFIQFRGNSKNNRSAVVDEARLDPQEIQLDRCKSDARLCDSSLESSVSHVVDSSCLTGSSSRCLGVVS